MKILTIYNFMQLILLLFSLTTQHRKDKTKTHFVKILKHGQFPLTLMGVLAPFSASVQGLISLVETIWPNKITA